jgi:phage N-6-adenine-methyltransferase
MNENVHFSSKTDLWATPQDFFDELDHEYDFQLDPYATPSNAKCDTYFTEDDDGLSKSWHEYGTIFMNPPYGRVIGKWVQKAYEEAQKGCTVVCLLPSRTDTKWFHDYCMKGKITFIRGRLKFGGSKNPAPFPSMVVVFTKDNKDGE